MPKKKTIKPTKKDKKPMSYEELVKIGLIPSYESKRNAGK